MQPELEKARAAGVAVLVDAGSPSLGRRADIIVAVSRAARLPVVVPTGFYLDPSIPEWARAASRGGAARLDGRRTGRWNGRGRREGGLDQAGGQRRRTHRTTSASACVPLPARAQRPTQPSAATARAASWPATRWTPWKGRATQPSASSGYTPTLNPGCTPTMNALGLARGTGAPRCMGGVRQDRVHLPGVTRRPST